MKCKFIKLYMDTALRVAELSYAERLKVGAIVVKNDAIISIGYNGMPAGWTNCCETVEEIWYDDCMISDKNPEIVSKTKPQVIHAEINAIGKLANNGISSNGAIMFCTHAPCIECAKAIRVAGISKVYYNETYRCDSGIEFLKQCRIKMIGPISEWPL